MFQINPKQIIQQRNHSHSRLSHLHCSESPRPATAPNAHAAFRPKIATGVGVRLRTCAPPIYRPQLRGDTDRGSRALASKGLWASARAWIRGAAAGSDWFEWRAMVFPGRTRLSAKIPVAPSSSLILSGPLKFIDGQCMRACVYMCVCARGGIIFARSSARHKAAQAELQ